MKDIIRESALGQLIRFLSRNKLLRYPEEEEDFQTLLEKVLHQHEQAQSRRDASKHSTLAKSTGALLEDTGTDIPAGGRENIDEEKAKIQPSRADTDSPSPLGSVTSTDHILVTWYSEEDEANPQNWSSGKKFYVASLIWLYTFSVYASSAIYVSSEVGVMGHFGVGPFKASLGLALFVLGYSTGPLIFSPISEIPSIGRNAPYIITFALFVILSIPTALANNLGGLLVLRFLQGFFGSPCLATGGGTMQDIYSMLYVPIAIAFWVSAAFSAPALGPLLSGFAIPIEGWRWSLWEVLWLSSLVFIPFFISMPETLAGTILLRRAKRLRKLTGDDKYVSQSELNQKDMSAGEIVKFALIKPFEINIKDPAILFTSIYSGIIYGTYYSFFEVFPLVYGGVYGFNLGETGLVFLCVVIGCLISMTLYDILILKVVIPDILRNGMGPQENVLKPALLVVFGHTISLFIFAWTSRPDIHWIVPTIFLTIYPFSVFIIFQAVFTYIPLSYPQYAASLFAGNDFFRGIFAFGAILFSRSMFVNEGIGKGVSILGGLSALGWFGMYYLYFRGAKLRAKSKFAVNEATT